MAKLRRSAGNVTRRKPPPYNPNQWAPKRAERGAGGLYVYTDDEAAWLAAIGRFRDRYRRPPTMEEAYALALCLGYRLTSPPESPAQQVACPPVRS